MQSDPETMYPCEQLIEQAPPLQTALPFDVGAGQAVQPGWSHPVFGPARTHAPLQSFIPAPEQTVPAPPADEPPVAV
jgi:hypothetical protein